MTAPVPNLPGTGLAVSAPVDGAGTFSASITRTAPQGSRNNATSSESLVYVSLVPGSETAGDSATIRSVTTGQSLTVPIVNGGFDPVAIAGNVGDELTVDVRGRAGAPVAHASVRIPPRRPPTIVRTNPPNGKTDVPLNSIITVVFSEPVDPTTLSGSVRLLTGTTAVAGTVTVESSGFITTFAPSGPLEPYTDYTIVIDTGIRDLLGDPLQQSAHIAFRTVTAPVGGPPSQAISQCSADATTTPTVFERVGSMRSARRGVTTLLPDGRALIYGGGPSDPRFLQQADVYDPATRTFANADQMMTSRGGHPAVLLPGGKLSFLDGIALQDGRVFFATPVSIYLQLQDGPFTPPNYAEIYDPATDAFTRLADYAPSPILWDTATLLLDGRVLLTGFKPDDFSNVTQLFDPRTNTFRNTGGMKAWYDTSGWGTLLADGTVLFVQWCFDACDDAVELYDPSTETFSVVGTIKGDLPYSRSVRLADGRVLITGGQLPGGNGTNEALLYSPTSHSLTLSAPMNCGRHMHSATLLPDGTALIAGGYGTWPSLTPSAEVFHPPAP